MFRWPLFYLTVARECKSSEAGNSDSLKCKVKSEVWKALKWKGESSWLNKEKKNSYDEIAKIYDKNESSIHEIVRKEK